MAHFDDREGLERSARRRHGCKRSTVVRSEYASVGSCASDELCASAAALPRLTGASCPGMPRGRFSPPNGQWIGFVEPGPPRVRRSRHAARGRLRIARLQPIGRPVPLLSPIVRLHRYRRIRRRGLSPSLIIRNRLPSRRDQTPAATSLVHRPELVRRAEALGAHQVAVLADPEGLPQGGNRRLPI